MVRIYAKHPPYQDGHLARVANEMDLAGAPTIRVMKHRGELYAIEGSHRLFLSHERGLVPKLIVLEPDVAGCDAFFDKIKPGLPIYDFDHVLVLEENKFHPSIAELEKMMAPASMDRSMSDGTQ